MAETTPDVSPIDYARACTFQTMCAVTKRSLALADAGASPAAPDALALSMCSHILESNLTGADFSRPSVELRAALWFARSIGCLVYVGSPA